MSPPAEVEGGTLRKAPTARRRDKKDPSVGGRSPRHRVTHKDWKRVKAGLAAGKNRNTISRETGLHYSTVDRIAEDLVKKGELVRLGGKWSVPVF